MSNILLPLLLGPLMIFEGGVIVSMGNANRAEIQSILHHMESRSAVEKSLRQSGDLCITFGPDSQIIEAHKARGWNINGKTGLVCDHKDNLPYPWLRTGMLSERP